MVGRVAAAAGAVALIVGVAVACGGDGAATGTVPAEIVAVDEAPGTAVAVVENDGGSPAPPVGLTGGDETVDTAPSRSEVNEPAAVDTDDDAPGDTAVEGAASDGGVAAGGAPADSGSVVTEQAGPDDAGSAAAGATAPAPAAATDHPPVDTGEDAATGAAFPPDAPAADGSGSAAVAGEEVVVSADVPDLAMVDVSTGSTVSLRSVVTGRTPLLFWFWSPL